MSSNSPLETIRTLFSELMGWDGEELMPIDFVMASYLTAFLPGAVEKAWGDLCGPPSIGKSEILRALWDGQNRNLILNDITENAFSSAYRDEENPEKDFSLVARLTTSCPPKGPKVLILPELSTFLSMRGDKVSQFFSRLRSAFDGSHTTAAGNLGIETKEDLNFGLLTACTEKLDEFRRHNQTLGERTLVCRIGRHTRNYSARQAVADHVVSSSRVPVMHLREQIQETTKLAIVNAILTIGRTGGDVVQVPSLCRRVGRLAALATSVRTVPLTSSSYVNLAEGPGRMAKQLAAWGDCRVLFDGREVWTPSDYQLVRRIAQDTMPPENLRIISALYHLSQDRGGLAVDLQDVLKRADVDTAGVRQMQQWSIIGLVHSPLQGRYRVNTEVENDIQYTQFLEGLEDSDEPTT